MLTALREIDGAWGEGGGQLIRTAVALAASTHTPIRVHNVRAALAGRWIAATLDRESRAFGTRVEWTSNGELRLAPEKRA